MCPILISFQPSGKSGLSPAQTPLRTVYDSFPHTAQAFRKSSSLSGEPANYLTSRYGLASSDHLRYQVQTLEVQRSFAILIFRGFTGVSRDGTPRGSGRLFRPDNVSIRIHSITEWPLLSPRSQSLHPHGCALRFHFPHTPKE